MHYIEERQISKQIGQYTFSSQFDQGNASDFKQVGNQSHYEVYIAPDPQGLLLFN